MHPFCAAVESGDMATVETMPADTVVFTSPVAFAPYRGKAITAAILRGVARVFEDFRYVRVFESANGRDRAFEFTARVGDREVHGCDFLHFDDDGLVDDGLVDDGLVDDGLVDDLAVMVRPLSGANALAEAMAAQFARIEEEVGGR